MASVDASRARDIALATLSAGHLHQSLWLPETPDHPRLRVTYSTTSNFDDQSLPAVLFIPPMFGSRWLVLEVNELARDCGVRVVFPERPGMGGSTPVPLSIRVQVWLETVPILLQKVNVKHVSIVTHSAGGVYTLNTLARLRSVLEPKAPYVALLAPWVPSASSNVTLVNIASKIPSPVIGCLSSLQGFVLSKVAPTLSFSGGLISTSAALLGSTPDADAAAQAKLDDEDATARYGVDAATAKQMLSYATKFSLAESTAAGNEEAKLCLMKGGKESWGVLADYEACVRSIVDNEVISHGQGEVARLKIDAAFAASDMLIGKGGQEFFEKCWRQEGMAGKVDFESRTVKGTDHDSILSGFEHGVLEGAFRKIAARSRLEN